MKLTTVFILLLSFIGSTAFSQTESAASRDASAKFEKFYNAGQYDSIYATFSAPTKVLLPLDKTTAFLTQLNSSYGHITQRRFVEYQTPFAVYKTTFEKGSLLLSLAVDNNGAITGLYRKPYEPDTLRNITPMYLPFKGEWTVFWGGDTRELNYHVVVRFQKNAFDIVINKEGRSFKTDGKTNEDYYAFGQPIIAPCDGEVVFAVNGVKDNVPGVLNPMYVLGNAILLKTKTQEYILLAHFKQNTIKVKQGDVVKQGQTLGQCGNSGNSSEPHLHFHLQNVEDFNQATGVKCYFDKLIVNGVPATNYSPIKGDRIKGE
ncbi:M23 family metallopeptidase [Chitinophaga sp.]|uniref:M23 family metallopeptidase n=1 Tax=Chitinophaga sp. TaxID=1869181 RepID=UPI002F92FBA7